MKKIEGIVRSTKLAVLEETLQSRGFEGMTITEVYGSGREKAPISTYRGVDVQSAHIIRYKVEIVVVDERADEVIDLIYAAAHTGEVGDGRIFVSELENVINIRTGETSESLQTVAC